MYNFFRILLLLLTHTNTHTLTVFDPFMDNSENRKLSNVLWCDKYHTSFTYVYYMLGFYFFFLWKYIFIPRDRKHKYMVCTIDFSTLVCCSRPRGWSQKWCFWRYISIFTIHLFKKICRRCVRWKGENVFFISKFYVFVIIYLLNNVHI